MKPSLSHEKLASIKDGRLRLHVGLVNLIVFFLVDSSGKGNVHAEVNFTWLQQFLKQEKEMSR